MSTDSDESGETRDRDRPRNKFALRRDLVMLGGVSFLLSACGGGAGGSSSSGSPGSVAVGASGNPPLPDLVPLASPEGDAVVLAADDPANPMNIFRIPVTRRMQQLSVEISAGAASDFDKLDRFLTFVDRLGVGTASNSTPDAAVMEGVGACTTYTHVFLALAVCQGMPGRYVNFHNHPLGDGHSIVEVLVGGQWVLIDPTYHLYYGVATPRGIAGKLSYDRSFQVVAAGEDLLRIGGNARDGLQAYTGAAAFRDARPQGVIGPANPMWFPLALDAQGASALVRGNIGPWSQGAYYIGAASEDVEQLWSIANLVPGTSYQFLVQPAWLGGDFIAGDNYQFVVEVGITGGSITSTLGGTFDFSQGGLADLIVTFVAAEASVTIRLGHAYRGPRFRYVSVASYAVEPANAASAALAISRAMQRARERTEPSIRAGVGISAEQLLGRSDR
jgi:hypothetical protein